MRGICLGDDALRDKLLERDEDNAEWDISLEAFA
jgi:hypothetical protein